MRNLQATAAFILLSIAIFLPGCRPAPGNVAATMAVQVAAAVDATIAAHATATPRPTLTLYPTLTVASEEAPAATLMPRPTLTARPTYTPRPTWTPLPTATLLSSPTATARAAVIAVATPGVASPTADVADAVLALAQGALDYVDRLSRLLTPRNMEPYQIFGNPTFDRRVDCVAFVSAYDTLRGMAAIEVGAAAPAVQSAYADYRSAIDVTGEAHFGFFVEECRSAIASGAETMRETGEDNTRAMQDKLDQARDLLHQAIHALGG